MSNLEHLIENTLRHFTNKEENIYEKIKNDLNFPYCNIDAEDVYTICQYIYYSYEPAQAREIDDKLNNEVADMLDKMATKTEPLNADDKTYLGWAASIIRCK